MSQTKDDFINVNNNNTRDNHNFCSDNIKTAINKSKIEWIYSWIIYKHEH